MARTLIIGYGNPLRGDDRLGWRAAEVLENLPEVAQNPEVEIVICHQLTPELAEKVGSVELVLFIDAAAEGVPGTWNCKAVSADAALPDALGHHFTPLRVLAYAHAIFGAKPQALVISVAAESFELGEDLSPAVEAALPEVVECVRGWITPDR